MNKLAKKMQESRPSSRIPGFYKMSVKQRHDLLVELGIIDEEEREILEKEGPLTLKTANQMIENVIGVLELPLGLGLSFRINDKDYIVPMAVEEPSIVAAVSHIAKIIRETEDGFQAYCNEPRMIGQIQVVGCKDWEEASAALLTHKKEIIALANTFEPGMVRRGGGAKDLEVRMIDSGKYQKMLVVHLLVDTCDAMGANMINTMAEGVAQRIEELTGGSVFLRILSNLADRRTATAMCRIPFEKLKWRGYEGVDVAKGIELASQFAEVDPYRACTHNKGVMNGISAVCIATGNDWRAIEAGAHAFCVRDGVYGPMARWWIEDDHLIGKIELPMQLGTVGGPIKLHPTVKLVHNILNVSGADELACVMVSVGLAQNMAALKALATEGIQRGHMSLHARAVAATAGAEGEEIEEVVKRLIESKEIKVELARKFLVEIRTEAAEQRKR